MGLLSSLFSAVGSKTKKVVRVHDYSGGRTFATYPKRKNPLSRKSNRFGPKKR